MRIALICPTRGRPGLAKRFVESAFSTSDRAERLECLFYVDSDDPEASAYGNMVAELQKSSPAVGKISLIVGPAIGVPRAANALLDLTDADALMTTNDDQVFVDSGWDSRLEKEAAAFPDGVYCLWFNDGWESENFCTFPIVGRGWVEALGYLQLPLFEHFFADSWIWMLAKTIGRDRYIPDVRVEHRHWKSGKGEMDATYERHVTTDEDSRHARDRAVIDRFERYFYADVAALQSWIEATAKRA